MGERVPEGKMSLTDALLRIDCICKKYEGYTKEAAAEDKAASKDPFSELYNAIDGEIENLIQARLPMLAERVYSSCTAHAVRFYARCCS